MDLIFVHVEGSQETRPLEFDATTSDTVIYIRKNIERITRTDKTSGETIELWAYDEAEVNADAFKALVSAMLCTINDTDKDQNTNIEGLGDAIIEMSEIIYS